MLAEISPIGTRRLPGRTDRPPGPALLGAIEVRVREDVGYSIVNQFVNLFQNLGIEEHTWGVPEGSAMLGPIFGELPSQNWTRISKFNPELHFPRLTQTEELELNLTASACCAGLQDASNWISLQIWGNAVGEK